MFVSHIFATQSDLPPLEACLYQYVVASNGIFVRASRPGLEALVPVILTANPVRGLASVRPFVRVSELVPRYMTERLFLSAWQQGRRESLYYLGLDLRLARPYQWRVDMPKQVQSPGGVHPVDPFAGGADTVLEVHSHHSMAACFSGTDDREERAGFRLFAVLGRLNARRPEIRVRAGVYGYFWDIPAAWVFDLPPYALDSLGSECDQEVTYADVPEIA